MLPGQDTPAPFGLERLRGSPLALRTATGLVAVPILVVVVLIGGHLWTAIVALVLALAMWEFATTVGLGLRDSLRWIAVAACAALAAVARTADIPTAWPLTAAILALPAAPVLAQMRKGDAAPPAPALLQHIGLAMFGTAYFGWLGSYFVLLRERPDGEEWLLLAIFAVMATDTGAYASGRLLGRRLLAPRLSPNKTVEGAIGGLTVGFAAVLLINLLPDLQVALWKMIILGVALPIAAQLGDLAESALKRALGVKDFGALVPGHGGVPDRLDSLLFGIPAVYFFLEWVVL